MKSGNSRKRILKVSLFSILLSVSIVLLSGSAVAQSLKIFCIDVDQGSSNLIVTPDNKSILIDCGNDRTAESVYKVITNVA